MSRNLSKYSGNSSSLLACLMKTLRYAWNACWLEQKHSGTWAWKSGAAIFKPCRASLDIYTYWVEIFPQAPDDPGNSCICQWALQKPNDSKQGFPAKLGSSACRFDTGHASAFVAAPTFLQSLVIRNLAKFCVPNFALLAILCGDLAWCIPIRLSGLGRRCGIGADRLGILLPSLWLGSLCWPSESIVAMYAAPSFPSWSMNTALCSGTMGSNALHCSFGNLSAVALVILLRFQCQYRSDGRPQILCTQFIVNIIFVRGHGPMKRLMF